MHAAAGDDHRVPRSAEHPTSHNTAFCSVGSGGTRPEPLHFSSLLFPALSGLASVKLNFNPSGLCYSVMGKRLKLPCALLLFCVPSNVTINYNKSIITQEEKRYLCQTQKATPKAEECVCAFGGRCDSDGSVKVTGLSPGTSAQTKERQQLGAHGFALPTPSHVAAA